VELMIKIFGSGSYSIIPFPEDRKKIDIGDFYADYEKIKGELGWSPRINLEEGIKETLKYYSQFKKYYW
jgi:UDP-glucose 4-epimerase